MRYSRDVYGSSKSHNVSHQSRLSGLTLGSETVTLSPIGDFLAQDGSEMVDIKVDLAAVVELVTSIIDAQIPDVSRNLREIIVDNIELALQEGANSRRIRADRPGIDLPIELPEPLKELSEEDVQAIRQVGRDHDWDDRSPDTRPLDWVIKYYGPWIPGLMTCHIKQADPKLYASFMRQVSREGLPMGIDIPTHTENEARKIAKSAIENALSKIPGQFKPNTTHTLQKIFQP